jgi:prophage DNA circulation protein
MSIAEVDEAVVLIEGMTGLLLRSVPAKSGRAVYELRKLVGELHANAEMMIYQATVGTQMQLCFEAALDAGATFVGLEAIRRYFSDATIVGLLAQAVAHGGLMMCLAGMGRVIADMVFRSRDDVQAMIVRMKAALDPMKEVAANELPAASYQALNELGASIMRHLSRTELRLPRKIVYNAKKPKAGYALSYLIYADAARSDEIIAENKIVHPAFCPVTVRALSE